MKIDVTQDVLYQIKISLIERIEASKRNARTTEYPEYWEYEAAKAQAVYDKLRRLINRS